LTIASFLLERYVVTRDECERASMAFYMNEANLFEKYMNVMMALGRNEWTRTVDESVWPQWMCAKEMIDSHHMCKAMSDDDCKRACDTWSQRVLKMRPSSHSTKLDLWKHEAVKMVARHWSEMSMKKD
jgi:hypothetical protein